MDATQREMILVSIANNIAEGREPMPMYDDSEEVQALYCEEVERFKIAYGRQHGMGGRPWTSYVTDAEVLYDVKRFEEIYGVSVIELEHKRVQDRIAFQALAPWERAPETWAN